MSNRLPRRKIAEFVARELLNGTSKKEVLTRTAAYLVTSRRTRELELLIRDIEDMLAERGIVVADVTSAHALTPAIRDQIDKLVAAKSLQLREKLDESLLGGLRIDLPGRRFDGTILRKLNALKAKQL